MKKKLCSIKITGLAPGLLMMMLLLLTACATAPPDETMAQADLAIRTARQSEANLYAPLELQLAEDKLVQARQAVADENMIRARRLAEEALVDARLAEEKSQTAHTRQLVDELRDSVSLLRQEIDRRQSQ